ncbi:MAG: prephenate dehydrogenase/arogenate dehydrogenase family protein [Planctomycetota bacterium]|jgi:prephenate dehydrogenase|nr:prephenate dehydrogenase/arogenate dehydrogenase family protein [Planctomycetota bacterium]
MSIQRKTLGIIGMGAFGRFLAGHLAPWFDLKAHDPRPPEAPPGDGAPVPASLAATAACDLVVFAVPLAALPAAAAAAAAHLRPGTLVLDVTSVKVRPVEILSRLLPESVDLFCTHPLFGPQSGKNGIVGLKIALCPVRLSQERFHRVFDFLTDRLKLSAFKTTPEEHDREMARVQAMTHFISRALKEIGMAPSPMATHAYDKLQEFASVALSDSWDLFLTIQNGNPFAGEMRGRLKREMESLERRLGETVPVDAV